jgi:fibro-slime domain-containing protein
VCARCGKLGDVCCAGNACDEGCCSGSRCLAAGSPGCPTGTPDGGGAPDTPLGGAGGAGGVDGQGGAGGAGGTGLPTGGAGGTTTPWTIPAGCGDGVVTPPEQCDDFNTLPFDGCSSDCKIEPRCNGVGPCTSTCGDGLVVGEECDDGNLTNGDGCSSGCKVEGGFYCLQPDLGGTIRVPVVYRDFRFKNPSDFETGITGSDKASTGMVQSALDSDGKPVFTGLTGTAIHVASADTFATWYRTSSGINHATPSTMVLYDNSAGAYVNHYGANGELWPVTETAIWCGNVGTEVLDTNGNPIPCTYKYGTTTIQTDCDKAAARGEQLLKCTNVSGTYQGTFLVNNSDGNPLFFPVDGDDFTPSSERLAAQIPPLYLNGATTWPYDVDDAGSKRLHNFSFTSEIHYWFKFDAGRAFRLDVIGDDDVWVFVNKQLAVDLGGIHTPVQGAVTLDATAATKFGLTDGNVYEVAVFQAERQSTSSTLKITLSGFNTAPSQCYKN